MTAIRKNPANRYPNMHILLDDLGKVDDPSARLCASPAKDDRYEPESEAGKLLAAALERNVTRRSRVR